MTALTPEQLRALAEMAGALAYHDRDKYVAESVAALRAAADQLDAVQAVADYLRDERWDDPTFDPELRLRSILTANTAPQETSAAEKLRLLATTYDVNAMLRAIKAGE